MTGNGGKKTPRKKRPDLAATKRTLEELFARQPLNDAELKRRLAPLSPARTRRVLVDLLESGEVEQGDGGLFEAALLVVGLGTQRERLIELVGRPGLAPHLRMVVLNVLDEPDRERAAPLIQTLPREEQNQLFWAPLMELMVTLQSDPDASVAVTDILLDVSDEERDPVLHQIGHCRRETGTPAAVVYRHPLFCDELAPFHGSMVDAVVEEGGSEGIALLEELRAQAKQDNRRHAYLQKSLLRLRTHAIEPERLGAAECGVAYLSSCDGQGTYALLGCFENPDGSATLSSLCVRASGELRDALVMPRFEREELSDFIDTYREGAHCELVEVPLGEAAWLASEAANRTRGLGLPLPADVEPALALFGRTHPKAPQREEPAKARPTLAQTRKLLARPEYESWYFDWGDLESAGVPLPTEEVPDDDPKVSKWLDQARQVLDSEIIGQRLALMAEHMTSWHLQRAEPAEASLCAAFARATRMRGHADGALLRAMLERSWSRVREEQSDAPPETRLLGDAVVRHDLRAHFFSEVDDPRGRHLARLDFTEAALAALDDAVTALPGHRRPRADQVLEIAGQVAETYAQLTLAPKTTRKRDWPGELADELMEIAPLSPEEVGQLMGAVLAELDVFVEQVCSRCPVDCLGHPSTGVADAFFGDAHPASIE